MALDFKVRIMLDSGAFSAWRIGARIDLKKYIGYIQRNKKWLHSYIALDDIPANRSPEAIEASAILSYNNHQAMKDAGLSPIPVVHRGEKFKWLERYLTDGERYIGLSPLVKSRREDMVQWLDQCFTMLTDHRGYPLIKTHGFAVTSGFMVARYPWFTVDSTTWSITGGFGHMLLPSIKGGVPDYLDMQRVHLTSHSGRTNPFTFDHLGPRSKAYITAILREHGLSIGEIRNTTYARTLINGRYFQGLEKQCQHQRFLHRSNSLLDGADGFIAHNKRAATLPLTIMFNSQPKVYVRQVMMNDLKMGNRLYNFYEMQDYADDILPALVKTGLTGVRTQGRAGKNRNHTWTERYRIFRVSKLAERMGEKKWAQAHAETMGTKNAGNR